MRTATIAALYVIAVSPIIPLVAADGKPQANDKEDAFGGKVIYLITKPKDAKSECGYGLYEKAKVIRLADCGFLVGQLPHFGEDEVSKAAAGKRVWTPISDIVQMTEFDTVEDAKRYFETVRKGDNKTEPPHDKAKEVKRVQQKLAEWLNASKDNTRDQVIKKLGMPSEKSTWEFDGKNQPLLRYRSTSPKTTLELYFHGNRVITASLQVLSD